jgi:phosphoribosyl 1,2-cyclic phosphodiesterase
MFKFCNLYSGSSGNCSFVGTDNINILVDCGESQKKISNALESIGKDISKIDAIIVTHEHIDHVKNLGAISKKFNIPVYANEKTFENMPDQTSLIDDKNKKIFNTDDHFEIGDLKIYPFNIPHDAAEPCGYNIYNGDKKISIATDIGHMDNNILKKLEESQFLLLESNYEPEILKYAKYPYYLKQRIAGPNGHLSNQEAGLTITKLVYSGVNNIMLGHLSKQTNFPELAYKTVMEEIIKSKINSELSLNVASRLKPSKVIEIS